MTQQKKTQGKYTGDKHVVRGASHAGKLKPQVNQHLILFLIQTAALDCEIRNGGSGRKSQLLTQADCLHRKIQVST